MKGAIHIFPPEMEKRSEDALIQLPVIREIMIESLCRGTLVFPPLAYLRRMLRHTCEDNKGLVDASFFEEGDFSFPGLYFSLYRALRHN